MVIKTRQQRLQEAEAGAQPSPPRSLIDEPRAKRARTTKSSADASSHDPPTIPPAASDQKSTTARASTSKRGSKATQRGVRGKGRARPVAGAQIHVRDDVSQPSQIFTESTFAADSVASAQVDGHAVHLMGHTDGETHTFPTGSEATHPVFAGVPMTHLVQDAAGETQTPPKVLEATHPVSAGPPMTQLVKDADGEAQTSRAGSGATQPVYAATFTPTSARSMQVKRFPSEISELFRQKILSPTSPTQLITHLRTPNGNQANILASGTTKPVTAAASTPTSAKPIQGKPFPPGTSPLFRQIMSSQSSPTVPVTNHGIAIGSQASSPGSSTTQATVATPTNAQSMQGKRSPSETSELFRQCISSPSSPPTSVIKDRSPLGSHASRANPETPRCPPTATDDGTPIGHHASRASLETTHSPPACDSQSLGAQPVVRGPMASLPHPVMPKVHGLPTERAQNYSLIHILVDSLPATTGDGGVPQQDSNIAFAIPSSKITQFLTMASQYVPELKDLMNKSPVAPSTVIEPELTCELPIDTHRSQLQKRKRNEDEEVPETVITDETAKTVGKTMRRAFAKMADERRRAALKEPRPRAKIPVIEDFEEHWIDPREISEDPNPYTYDEVPDPDRRIVQGLPTSSQDHVQQDQVPQEQIHQDQIPETPTARGWGLSSLFPSVSRFIPFSSRRTPPATVAPLHVLPNTQAPADSPTLNEQGIRDLAADSPTLNEQGPRDLAADSPTLNEQGPRDLAASQQPLGSRLGAQTEPRQRSDATKTRHGGEGLATSSALAERVHREKPQRMLLTKKQAAERRKLKEEKEKLRADKERLAQEEARITQEKKEWEEERGRAKGVQIPGKKRKRLPSPEFYPLPAVGFGLVDAIFEYSSDEESSEEEQDTPTRPRPFKKTRLSSSSVDTDEEAGASQHKGGTLVGLASSSNPFRKTRLSSSNMDIWGNSVASQYTGESFAGTGMLRSRGPGNVFGSRATVDAEASMTTPSGPSKNTFTVPSPTDSDSDEETVEEETPNAAALPSHQGQSPQVATTSPSKSMPPPPTPNPSHNTLPSAPSLDFVDPVERAREKALKHQPRYGSRLRESSRLSSSTVGSEAETEPLEEDNAQVDESQYDPRNPAMLQAFTPSNHPKSVLDGHQATTAQGNTTVRHRPTPWDGMGFSYDLYRKTITPNVEAHIEVTWDEDGDDLLIGLGDREFEANFEAWKQEEYPEEANDDGGNVSNTVIESDQLSYEKENISARVRVLIDENVTGEDEDMGISEFDEAYEAFKASEMQNQDASVPTIIA